MYIHCTENSTFRDSVNSEQNPHFCKRNLIKTKMSCFCILAIAKQHSSTCAVKKPTCALYMRKKRNKTHCKLHYSGVRITAVIKHHYNQSDPRCGSFSVKQTSQHNSSSSWIRSAAVCTRRINYTIICTGARKSRGEGRDLRKPTSKATPFA